MSKIRIAAAAVVCAVLVSGCKDHESAVNPESHDPVVHGQDEAALRQVPFAEVVAAVFAVTTHDAGAALERHLTGRADALLAKWPRLPSGTLDLDRPPVAATELSADIGPGSKSRCGDVVVIFGDGAISLRAQLPVPATTPQCRGILRDNHVTGAEALPLLRAAVAEARVPVPVSLPVVAAN